MTYLRPGKRDGARHAWAILALLAKRLHQAWPKVKIAFCGDSGFCRRRILSWCEREGVDYIVGIARNAALAKKAKPIMELAELAHEASDGKLRLFKGFRYAAKPWKWSRRVIVKAEHPGEYPNGLLRTVQRRVKVWREEKATEMVFGEFGELPTDEQIADPVEQSL